MTAALVALAALMASPSGGTMRPRQYELSKAERKRKAKAKAKRKREKASRRRNR